MKKVLFVLIAFAIMFAGCDGDDDKNSGDNSSNNGDGKTTLTIKNTSDYDFTNVEYSSVDFGNIDSNKERRIEVQSNTTKPITFTLEQPQIYSVLCTTDSVTCDEGKNRTITISNNTRVSTDVGITDTLENIDYQLLMESKNR